MALLLPAPATARVYFSVRGAPAPGPAKYDKVGVLRLGPVSARHVLVLVPGTQEAAGSQALAGGAIQRSLGRNWQVWAPDRREVAFEDARGLASGRPDRARSYYLHSRRRSVTTRQAPYVRRWGLKVALEDLRRVIRAARAGGRDVVLGGHSLGAQEALAYAAWDFAGRAGYRDLRGVVLIDGGLLGAFSSAIAGDDLARARATKSGIDFGSAFEDTRGPGKPWMGSMVPTVAALYARAAPDAPSALAADPVVPPIFRPSLATTNAGFLAQLFDETYARPGFEDVRLRVGDFAAAGNPRPWVDGENATVARLAAALAQTRPRWAESYFPRRLRLDARGANSMSRSRVASFLGLRLWHTREINVPVYAYQTDLTSGAVIRSAQRLMRASRIERLATVDDSANASHLDPLVAPPGRNNFVQTVVPFLRSLARR